MEQDRSESYPDRLGLQYLIDIVVELASTFKLRRHEETSQWWHWIAPFCYGFIPAFILVIVFNSLAKAFGASLTQLLFGIG
jgi:hypothetical protein